MLNQFRIGNCNFSLSSCRWKPITFHQKHNDTQLPRSIPSSTHIKCPSIRLHKSSVLLSDHVYMFGGLVNKQSETLIKKISSNTFCAVNLKNHRWHEIKLSSTPQNRDSHGMTIMKQEIFLFGGSNQYKYFNELYSFNNFANEWTSHENKVGSDVPAPRDPMVFVTVKNQSLLLIGGINLMRESEDERYLEDAFMWNNGYWKRLATINYPKGLILTRAVAVNGRLFLFGGMNRITQEYSTKLYELTVDQKQSTLNFNQFSLTFSVTPSGRVNHSLTPVNNQYFLLIGGQRLGQKTLKDLWVFDTLLRKWTLIEPANGPLKGIHSFSTVMYNNVVYIYGGFLQNQKELNSEVFTLEFANQQIFKSQICQNCVNLLQKKQQDSKKFPKPLLISVGFLYNLALDIRFPFHAVSMIYEASRYFDATQFRIRMQKTLNQFSYLKVEFDGVSFGRQQFLSFISHNFVSQQLKKFTENIKLGSFRLGKTFLLVTSDTKYRYTYLLSAQSRISPHFDEAYIYYSFVQNLQLQRIETQQGVKQRQFILNMLSQHISCPEIVLESREKTLLLIFEPKVVMSTEREYLGELVEAGEDIRVWKNQRKVAFLQDRGYKIWDDVEVSLRKWVMFYRLRDKQNDLPRFFINDSEQPVPLVSYKDILKKFSEKGVIHKAQLPTDTEIPISGELYITTHPYFLEHNYGLLIYSKSRLFSRFQTQFGRLFPQHFYKSKYKKATTIFHELGYLNVETGLDENYFKNGFNKGEKYASLMERIREKCDEKRREVMEEEERVEQEDGDDKVGKKVKL